MTTRAWIRDSVALAWLAALAAAAAAQPTPAEPQRYVKFKIDADYEAKLKERLAAEKELGPLKDLINQVLADPSKMPASAEQLKGFKLEDEKFKKALTDWVARDPELRKALQ